MERKKASEFPQELLNLFDGYVHGGISQRQFLDCAQNYADRGDALPDAETELCVGHSNTAGRQAD